MFFISFACWNRASKYAACACMTRAAEQTAALEQPALTPPCFCVELTAPERRMRKAQGYWVYEVFAVAGGRRLELGRLGSSDSGLLKLLLNK